MGEARRESDDSDHRWYFDGDSRVLSVTTVLKYLDEDTTGLDYWKQNNDGVGDNAHWELLLWFTGHRGTLCHWRVLEQFHKGTLWGEEETESMMAIKNGPTGDEFGEATATLDAATHSVCKRKGRGDHMDTTLAELVDEDLEWFSEQFDTVADTLGIDHDSIIGVEEYLLEDDVGYGGQCDLIYEATDGATVVADLKTSGGLRWKHRLQSIAYARAVEKADDIDVDSTDRVEVIRLAPDSKDVAVHSPYVPSHLEDVEWYTDEDWFDDPYGEFSYDTIDEMYEHFCELVEEAHDESTSPSELF